MEKLEKSFKSAPWKKLEQQTKKDKNNKQIIEKETLAAEADLRLVDTVEKGDTISLEDNTGLVNYVNALQRSTTDLKEHSALLKQVLSNWLALYTKTSKNKQN